MVLPDLEVTSNTAVSHVWTRKINVLLLSINYPLTMAKYFERAFRRNPNIDLKTVGPYTGSWIPWTDAAHPSGMNLPIKYAIEPDITLPFTPAVGMVDYEYVITLSKKKFPDWEPDIVLCVDAGIRWRTKPQNGLVVHVATDPHAIPVELYNYARQRSDYFFNMQKCYSEKDDIYLPYAYDPSVHYPEPNDQSVDAVLIGMPYEQRVQWVDELRKHGVSVEFQNHPIFDEYREIANKALIGLNWSSLNDLNARFFETPAFGLAMVANRVPDAHLFLKEDEDYLAFSTLPEAVEKVLCLKKDPDLCQKIATSGYQKIQGQTYDSRVDQILKECGFI